MIVCAKIEFSAREEMGNGSQDSSFRIHGEQLVDQITSAVLASQVAIVDSIIVFPK